MSINAMPESAEQARANRLMSNIAKMQLQNRKNSEAQKKLQDNTIDLMSFMDPLRQLEESKVSFKEMASLKSSISLDFQVQKHLELDKFEYILGKVFTPESKQAGLDIIKSVCMGDHPNEHLLSLWKFNALVDLY